jgi:hypothetical protein
MGAILINLNVDVVETWVERNGLRRYQLERDYQKWNLTCRRRSEEEGR